MTNDVRIRITAGVLAVVIIHAVVLALLFVGLHMPRHTPGETLPLRHADCANGQCSPVGEFHSSAPLTRQLPQVNTSARDEIKQQGGTICPSCDVAEAGQLASKYGAYIFRIVDPQTQTLRVHAQLPEGQSWAATGGRTTRAYSGSNAYLALVADMKRGLATAPQLTPQLTPTITPTITPATPRQPAAQPSAKKYQIALFLRNDSQSQSLLDWFKQNQELSNLATRCDFQIYTPDNPLYQTRYASQVPVDQFPAMLFLRSDGGHIHAAGRSMLPNSSDALVSDLKQSLALAQSAESAPVMSGLIRETGYNWDSSINPQMRLEAADCVDGSCTPDASGRVGPFGGGGLFDRVKDTKDAVLWAGVGDIATFGLLALIGLLAVAIVVIFALKRR